MRSGNTNYKKPSKLKILVYKSLKRLLPNNKRLVIAWYNGEKKISEVYFNIYNSKFPNSKTICLGGSTWSKNFGDALNVPLFNLQ